MAPDSTRGLVSVATWASVSTGPAQPLTLSKSQRPLRTQHGSYHKRLFLQLRFLSVPHFRRKSTIKNVSLGWEKRARSAVVQTVESHAVALALVTLEVVMEIPPGG
jgi:hypothetical protein